MQKTCGKIGQEVEMKDFRYRKPVIGIVGETLAETEWMARCLGGKQLVGLSGNNYTYESNAFIFECQRFGYKGATPHWDGIIFACDPNIDRNKREDWLNTVR